MRVDLGVDETLEGVLDFLVFVGVLHAPASGCQTEKTLGVTARWKPSKGRTASRVRAAAGSAWRLPAQARLRPRAVDAQYGAADEGRRRAQQEHDAGGGLGLVAEAPQRHGGGHRAQARPVLGRVVVHAAGSDVTRRHRIHAHTAWGPLHRRGLGEADHAGACRAAVAHAGHRAPHVGHDVDDGAAVLLHGLQVALARHQEAAGQVGVDHRLPALGAGLRQRRDVLAAGVVDQSVDPAMRGQHLAATVAHHILLADVAHMVLACPPSCVISACDRLQLVRLAADQRHRAPSAASSCAVQRPMPEPAAGDNDHQVGGKNRTVCHGNRPSISWLQK
jgi:hypothetical protein